jgi:hypothetical protein
MAAPIKKTTDETGDGDMHRIRITLTSRNMKAVEKLCEDLIRGAKKMVRVRARRAEFGGGGGGGARGFVRRGVAWRGAPRRWPCGPRPSSYASAGH